MSFKHAKCLSVSPSGGVTDSSLGRTTVSRRASERSAPDMLVTPAASKQAARDDTSAGGWAAEGGRRACTHAQSPGSHILAPLGAEQRNRTASMTRSRHRDASRAVEAPAFSDAARPSAALTTAPASGALNGVARSSTRAAWQPADAARRAAMAAAVASACPVWVTPDRFSASQRATTGASPLDASLEPQASHRKR